MQHSATAPGYMPTLDGVRGFACLLVFVQHMDAALNLGLITNPLGTLGVIIFFSLSGFLMGALYFDRQCGYDDAAKYVVSRFSRITPAYYIAILFCWVLYMVIPDFREYQMTPTNLVLAFGFMGSQGVFWSIPPEVQFYGFFLFMWFAFSRMAEGNYIWMALCVLLAGAFIATRSHWSGILLPSKFHIFLFGFLAALLRKRMMEQEWRVPAWLQILLVTAVTAYYVALGDSDNVFNSLPFAALMGLVILSLSVETSATAVFKTRLMRLIGAASFSIYLFHAAIMYALVHCFPPEEYGMAVMVPMLTVMGFFPPLLFHLYIERKLNRETKTRGLDLAMVIKQRFIKN